MVIRGRACGLCRARVRAIGGGDNISAAHSDSRSDSNDRASSSSGGSCSGGRGVCECTVSSSLELGKVVTRVDCEDHSLLAVVSLSAVDPDRICVDDSELSLRESIGSVVGNRLT